MRAWLFVVLAACGRDHFDPAHNYAFVTSTVHDPSLFLTDLAGADTICASSAADAGLLGDYVAYLSTTAVPAPSRLGNARGWIRIDGAPVVDRVADLVSGNLLNPLRIDEHGEDLVDGGGPVATGTDGSGAGDFRCLDWTTSGANYSNGFAHKTTDDWTHASMQTCTTLARLYCFGTSYDAALDITPATGRRMFVTEQAFVPGGGLAAADALCANEASLAGVSGTFLAMLPSSTASAASRFDLGGANWVRLDGIAVAESPLAFMAGELSASPNVTSRRTYTDSVVITGGIPAMLANNGETCVAWTNAASGAASAGHANESWVGAFTSVSASCVGGPIYCLEP
jgi:hypothetical protein